jgi:hypothetical protein
MRFKMTLSNITKFRRMPSCLLSPTILALLLFALCAPASVPSVLNSLPLASPFQKSRDIAVANYDGGVYLLTEGHIPDGPCFRVRGRLTAPNFFDNLKRIDDDHGATFRRGGDLVTEFPEKLFLSFSLYDQTCSDQLRLQQTSTHPYLTHSLVSSLRVSLYWKCGVELRPAGKVEPLHFTLERVAPYATSLASELPDKFLWTYEFAVPSAGVPLTDSLVLVFRNAQGQTLVRVAARL